MADAACTGLPAELGGRAYVGSLESYGSSGEQFMITLGGAAFYPTQRVMSGVAVGGAFSLSISSLEAARGWLEVLPIVEKVGPESYLSVLGRASGTRTSKTTSVNLDLDGTISFCPRNTENELFFECAVPPIDCQSARHHLTLAMR